MVFDLNVAVTPSFGLSRQSLNSGSRLVKENSEGIRYPPLATRGRGFGAHRDLHGPHASDLGITVNVPEPLVAGPRGSGVEGAVEESGSADPGHSALAVHHLAFELRALEGRLARAHPRDRHALLRVVPDPRPRDIECGRGPMMPADPDVPFAGVDRLERHGIRRNLTERQVAGLAVGKIAFS